jgi:hypothetical protein
MLLSMVDASDNILPSGGDGNQSQRCLVDCHRCRWTQRRFIAMREIGRPDLPAPHKRDTLTFESRLRGLFDAIAP